MDGGKSVCILYCHLKIPLKFLCIYAFDTPNAYTRSLDLKFTYAFAEMGCFALKYRNSKAEYTNIHSHTQCERERKKERK